MQKENFSIPKSFKWVTQNPRQIFMTPEILGIVLIIIAFNTNAKVMGICMVLFYMFMFLYELRGYKNMIKINSNIIRTIIITFIIYILLCVCFTLNYMSLESDILIIDNRFIYYTIMIICAYFNCFMVLFAGLINTGIMYIVNLVRGKQKK